MTSTLFVVAFVAMVMTLNPGKAQLTIEQASQPGVQVFLYNPTYKKYLFVSNDKKDQDNIVEANVHTGQPRYRFVIQRDGGQYRIYNPTYDEYMFVSNDWLSGDRIVEAYRGGPINPRIGARNVFQFHSSGTLKYRIYCPSENQFVFVSNDIKASDNVVEAKPNPNEPRNEFMLYRANNEEDFSPLRWKLLK